jgi:virginiamycin B lyase
MIHDKSFGGNMLKQSHALVKTAFFCLLLCILVAPGRSQGQAPAQPPRGGRGPAALPDGPGKDQVQTTCTKCHAVSLIQGAGGNSRQEWVDLFGTMVKLPNDQRDTIADYLAKTFPPQPRPAPVVVPGPMSVSFKEWNVPTLGSRPHDPEPGPGGTIWWTGMFANVIGRLDPKTGDMKEYPLKTPASGPHGLAFDKEGSLWFTANSKGYIGKLDPKTGDIMEYKLPEDVRDPHTPMFLPSGTLIFTAQNSNYIGRINPKTGEIKVQKTPTERANPYGVVYTSKGIPFVCDFGTNKIIQIDPETLAIKEFELPNAESRPRRIAISPDDIIWYADYSRGYLGRLDTKTGKVTDWPSPSGPKTQPYGITYLNGAIWYVESAIRPNVLVRFDIKTEKFQSWTIPGGGGVVRNMKATSDGNLVIAESGVNKVGLVLVGSKAPNTAR